jgi:hypothetical protein
MEAHRTGCSTVPLEALMLMMVGPALDSCTLYISLNALWRSPHSLVLPSFAGAPVTVSVRVLDSTMIFVAVSVL